MLKKLKNKAAFPTIFIAAVISLSFFFAATVPVKNASAGPFVSLVNWITGKSGPCYDNAGAPGWILCPALGALTDLLQSSYTGLVDQLSLPASALFDDTHGLRSTWSTFRNISNILFIILFLVVIISQLTGFGIDNYGIKRILPRIVVVAILINLSYIICQIAVDVSNILGSSLKDLFIGMANSIPLDTSGINQSEAISFTIGGVASDVAGITLLLPLATIISGVAMIVGLIICLFVAISGVWTAMLYTVARTIGIVICVALSPVAFAAFLLPNTEKLFKKWLDLMKNLLMIYPICSMLLGVGFLIGKILAPAAYATTGVASFINSMAVMLAPVVCFFAIPKVLKGSLASMGVMGRYISNRRQKAAITRKAASRKAMDYAKSSQTAARIKQNVNLKLANTNRKFSEMGGRGGVAGIVGKVGAAATDQAAANARRENVGIAQKLREREKWTSNEVVTRADSATGAQVPVWVDKNGVEVAAGTAGAHQLTKSEQYARQLNRQGEAAFSGEQVRMYADQFSNQSRGQNNQELISAINEHNPQKFAAAFRTLIQQGGHKEALEALYEHGGKMDVTTQTIARQEMAGAGNPIMKEYVKAVESGRYTGDFASFVSGGGLAEAFKKKGDSALVGMDKDNLDFINNVNSAAKVNGQPAPVVFSAQAIANGASATTNGEEITRFATMARGLSEDERKNIINNMSAEQVVHMNNEVKVALAGAPATATDDQKALAIATAFSAQLQQIEKDPKLRGRMSQSDQEHYFNPRQGPPPPPPSPAP